MRRFYGHTLVLLGMLYASVSYCQPAVLGTQTDNGTYTTYDLTDLGIFRQTRIQATSSAAAGTRNWEFCEGTAAVPDYDPAWRPYTCCLTLAGYNQTIQPVGGTSSALFNLGFGGVAGNMPAITAGNYYTFNCTEYSTPGVPANEYMGVLQTTYNPVAISSVTQSPAAGSVYPENSVYVTVNLAAAPSAGEYVYVRYSTNINFTTSTLLTVTIAGTSGTVEIPCQASGTTIYYYAYTSNRTSASILADVGTSGQVAHDMSTLNINNNGGPNYTYTVLPSIGFCGNYYVPSACYPTINSFVTALNAGTVSCAVTCYVAAGHTETVPVDGIILTQTGTAANTITFVKNGAGADPILYAWNGTATISAVSNVSDGVFTLLGSDYVTIDGIDIVDNNVTGSPLMEYGYGLFKASASNGCQHNVIRNCTITLNKNNVWTAAPINFEFGSRGITMHNSTRTNLTALLTIASAAGRNDYNRFYGNTIKNVLDGFVVSGYNDGTSPYSYYDQNNEIGIAGTGNIIENFGGSGLVRACGIFTTYQNNLTITYNTINNTLGGGIGHSNTLYGIFQSGNVGTQSLNTTITYNDVELTQGAVSSTVTAIRTGSSGYSAGNIYIENNTIQNCIFTAGATGTFEGIHQEFNAANNSIRNNIIQNNTINSATTSTSYIIYDNNSSLATLIDGNTLTNNMKTASSSGALIGYTNQTGAVASSISITNNTITSLGVPVGSATYTVGIRLTTSTSQTKTVANNTISNITGGTGTTVWTTGLLVDFMPAGSAVDDNTVTNVTSAANAIGINCAAATSIGSSSNVNFSLSGNTVSSVSSTGASNTVVGIATYPTTAVSCTYNAVSNISSSGATAPVIRGISIGGGASGSTLQADNNSISYVTYSGAGSIGISGLYILSGQPTVSVQKNHIWEISSTGANCDVSGFTLATGTSNTINIANNFIQRLYAGSSTKNMAVMGLNLLSTTATYNIYYNTIALGQNTSLSGATGAAGFGCSGIYHYGLLNMRNNLIYVNATTSGTGVASCVRRATANAAGTAPATSGTGITTTSNENYYYLNQAANNYIYVEGTSTTTIKNGYAYGGATTSVANNLNNDPCFNIITPATLTSYKYFMSLSGGGSRELNALYDIPHFAGGASLPQNIKLLVGATDYAESHAVNIAGYTTDYEGDIRQGNPGYLGTGTAPDRGADEAELIFIAAQCALLPIELIEFTGWYNGEANELHWKTATEINSDVFEIEKSVDGINFFTIGTVDAAGYSLTELDYAFIDDNPVTGMNYYRLRMVDNDGAYDYSNTIAIRVDADGIPSFVVFPNPANAVLHFAVVSTHESNGSVSVVDMLGRVLIQQPVVLHDGQNTFGLDISHLARASYIVYLIDENGVQHSMQFIKE